MDVSQYPHLSADDLVAELARVVNNLSALYRELSTVAAEEARQRLEGYAGSMATSVAGREREADASALHLTTEVMDLRGQINGHIEIRALLTNLINWKYHLPTTAMEMERV